MAERIAQVYVIRLGDTNYFKVGMTTDINGRIATLQTATPFDLHLIAAAAHKNAYTIEHDIHELLKPYRVRNEWFDCDQSEVMRVFETVNAMCTIDRALDDRSLELESIIERTLNVSHQTIAQINRVLRSEALKSPIFNDEIDDTMM